MRRILIILSLLFCISKLSAQNQIIIPKGQDSLFRVVILPWYGLDPIQTKDGNFILPAKILKDLEAFNVSLKFLPVTTADKVLLTELEKLPVKDIKLIILKEVEEIKIVPKLIIR